MFSINPDAHSTSEIDLVRWGVSIARKGGIPPGRVLTCLGLKAFTKWLDARRAARAKMRIDPPPAARPALGSHVAAKQTGIIIPRRMSSTAAP
jgi:hypothetical protein